MEAILISVGSWVVIFMFIGVMISAWAKSRR